MPVLSRDLLEGSSLSDLHAIASQLGLDGFRRLRKEDLVDAISARQGGEAGSAAADSGDQPVRRTRARRAPRAAAGTEGDADSAGEEARANGDDAPAPRTRSRRAPREADGDAHAHDNAAPGDDADGDAPAPRARRPRRGAAELAGSDAPAPRARRAPAEDEDDAPARPRRARGRGTDADGEDPTIEGVVEVLANGSGFVRVQANAASDDDAYVSAAQVKRCELVSGDRVSGPVRAARRSERHPSLVRVETINGKSADEVQVGPPLDELSAVFPTEAFAFTSKDATLKQITDLAPIGKGSRVVVHGPSGSGRSTTLRLLAAELQTVDGVELQVVLAGSRPEEVGEWREAKAEPAAAAVLGQSPDAQGQAIERAIEAARRVVAKGGDAVVIIDSLDLAGAPTARRSLAAARNVDGGGSLTVIAAAPAPVGGETTLIALDGAGALTERRPVLDPIASGTLRVAALVGARKATTSAKNRLKGLEPAS